MKKIAALLVSSVIVLGACGDAEENNEADPAEENNAAEENNTNENAADNGEYDLANGEEMYEGNCASCHGGDLEGGSGPGIEGLSHDEVLTAIQEGPGSMQADIVEGDDAEDVAAWVADQ